MRIKLWPKDTIARRFALTVVLAIVVMLSLTGIVIEFAGVWGRPPVRETGLLERADDIVRMVEAAPERERQTLMDAVANARFHADWYPATSTVAVMLDAAWSFDTTSDPSTIKPGIRARKVRRDSDDWVDQPGFMSGGHPRPVVSFKSDGQNQVLADLHLGSADQPNAYFAGVRLEDGSWVVFTAPTRVWGLNPPTRIGIGLVLLTISIAAVSAVATYQLSRPIREFTEALRRFGTDPRAAPIPETGPRELRASIGAFNAMQAQIQKFVDDRTAMLAAISHDLRTPLTKMRLRGEFVEDEEQRARLFRDVDDMQAMVDSALAFFRDDFQGEETTTFDFPEMLHTIADDYNDQGSEITYNGAEHVAFRGRPFALKRAFANLVDNAVKYGRAPEVELSCSEQQFVVMVRDSGPGIPPEATEQVFAPFYRLERSRNRATGGVGLGLTSARAVIRAHGGDISLRNRPVGGLEVQVTLPVAS
jgi:signal transduction histidine kinase